MPFMFHTIGVDDGIATGHMDEVQPGQPWFIADEPMVAAYRFDGLIRTNGDKIVPGVDGIHAPERPDDHQRWADGASHRQAK